MHRLYRFRLISSSFTIWFHSQFIQFVAVSVWRRTLTTIWCRRIEYNGSTCLYTSTLYTFPFHLLNSFSEWRLYITNCGSLLVANKILYKGIHIKSNSIQRFCFQTCKVISNREISNHFVNQNVNSLLLMQFIHNFFFSTQKTKSHNTSISPSESLKTVNYLFTLLYNTTICSFPLRIYIYFCTYRDGKAYCDATNFAASFQYSQHQHTHATHTMQIIIFLQNGAIIHTL